MIQGGDFDKGNVSFSGCILDSTSFYFLLASFGSMFCFYLSTLVHLFKDIFFTLLHISNL